MRIVLDEGGQVKSSLASDLIRELESSLKSKAEADSSGERDALLWNAYSDFELVVPVLGCKRAASRYGSTSNGHAA